MYLKIPIWVHCWCSEYIMLLTYSRSHYSSISLELTPYFIFLQNLIKFLSRKILIVEHLNNIRI